MNETNNISINICNWSIAQFILFFIHDIKTISIISVIALKLNRKIQGKNNPARFRFENDNYRKFVIE